MIESINVMSEFTSEFLVHAADVEGLCQGIDSDLVSSKIKKKLYLLQSL